MQEKTIKKYEPMIVVLLKNGRKLLTAATHRDEIEKRWNLRQINRIEGVTVDGYEIRTIEEISDDYDVLISLTEDQRVKAEARFIECEERLGRKPTRNEKLNFIERILNPNISKESLTEFEEYKPIPKEKFEELKRLKKEFANKFI